MGAGATPIVCHAGAGKGWAQMLCQSSVMQVQMQVRVLRPLSVIQVEAQSAVSVVGVVER